MIYKISFLSETIITTSFNFERYLFLWTTIVWIQWFALLSGHSKRVEFGWIPTRNVTRIRHVSENIKTGCLFNNSFIVIKEICDYTLRCGFDLLINYLSNTCLINEFVSLPRFVFVSRSRKPTESTSTFSLVGNNKPILDCSSSIDPLNYCQACCIEES